MGLGVGRQAIDRAPPFGLPESGADRGFSAVEEDLPLDPAAVARLTADDPEVAGSTTAAPSEPGQEAEPTRADAADVPIAASYVLARSDL